MYYTRSSLPLQVLQDGPKKGHSLSEKKLIGEYLAKLQARMSLSCALVRLANTLLKDRDHVLACNFAEY